MTPSLLTAIDLRTLPLPPEFVHVIELKEANLLSNCETYLMVVKHFRVGEDLHR